MMAIAALLQVVAGVPAAPVSSARQVTHDFVCLLRTSSNKLLKLTGDYQIREYSSRGRGAIKVSVRSDDKKWSFIDGSTNADFQSGPDWFRIMFDFTDPAVNQDTGLGALDDQEYTLDLNFPARLLELKGRLGFATLRAQKDDTPNRWEGLPYPISAVGPCDISPRKEATP